MAEEAKKPDRPLAWAALILLVCLFVGVSVLTFDDGDWPSPNQYPHNSPTVNACGPIGAAAAYYLRRLIGVGQYALLAVMTWGAVSWLIRGSAPRPWERGVGTALLVGSICAGLDLLTAPGTGMVPFGVGGLVGASVGRMMRESLSPWGSGLILVYCLIVAMLFLDEGFIGRIGSAFRAARRMSTPTIRVGGTLQPALSVASSIVGRRPSSEKRVAAVNAPDRDRRGAPSALRINVESPRRVRTAPPESPTSTLFKEPVTGETSAGQTQKSAPRGKPLAKTRPQSEPVGGRTVPQLSVTTREPPSPPEKQLVEQPPAGAYSKKLAEWKLPPLSILDSPNFTFTAAHESVLRAKAKTLESALREFRLDARVVEIDTGPVITMFELELAPGIKVSRVAALANDIARALKAPAVRIVSPVPGKSTIGIEVPNVDKERVRLKSLILGAGDRMEKMAVPLLLGKDASGNALVQDLTEMPHLLIAGTTGSGKSVSLNAIIMSILMCRRPDMVKLILIDPKMVELSHFKDVPHLMSPIITDVQRAEQVLDWVVAKMEERYALFAETRVRNITEFNRLGDEEVYRRLMASDDAERAWIPTHLPYIVVIIDELADLMMTSAKEVEHHLSRLAQKSRAVGVHIIVATQRPEARVVTGLIKSNLPCRCAFRVASRMDSRIVLDQNGAEVLMGQGDMLFLPPGSHKPIRAQGAYVEDHELTGVINFLTERGRPEFHPELVRARPGASGLSERDPLFDQAAEIILESQRGSVSLLQRRLTIGYSRASRLIDQMAEVGIVGDYKGSQAREVLMTLDEWASLKKEVAADMARDEDTASADERARIATVEADDESSKVGPLSSRQNSIKERHPIDPQGAKEDDEDELWEDDDDEEDDLDDDLEDDDLDLDDDEDDDLEDDEDEEEGLDDVEDREEAPPVSGAAERNPPDRGGGGHRG